MMACQKVFLQVQISKLLTENSALKLVTAVVMLPRPWAISCGGRQLAHPSGGETRRRDTHKAADGEVQDVQTVDGRAEGGRRGRERLDGGDDRVGALGHDTGRAEEDDGDEGDELAEELHGEPKVDVGKRL